MVVPLIFS